MSGPCSRCGQTISIPPLSHVDESGAPAAAARRPNRSIPVILLIVAGVVVFGICGVGILVALFVPFWQSGREAARRMQCSNNLRQIGVALHEYHAQYGSFPPAYIADENGKPMHSWRVLILPFLDEELLYEQYDFDEPWDGPNNSVLAAMMPMVYGCPSDADSFGGITSYVAVTGPGTAFPGAEPVNLQQITDRKSQTIMLIEARDEQIDWLEPRDLPLEDVYKWADTPFDQQPVISSLHPGGANVLYADGSIHFMDEYQDPETFKGMLTIDGGENLGNLQP